MTVVVSSTSTSRIIPRPPAWTAEQILEAFPFESAPKYLLRDRDTIYGHALQQQIEAMGIADVLGAPRAPWQRAYVERMVGSIRRDCLDHLIVLDESSLRRLLRRYFDYYHESRTHLRSTKTLRYSGQCILPVESSPSRSSADFTIDNERRAA
jgi:transposase InsO family protein